MPPSSGARLSAIRRSTVPIARSKAFMASRALSRVCVPCTATSLLAEPSTRLASASAVLASRLAWVTWRSAALRSSRCAASAPVACSRLPSVRPIEATLSAENSSRACTSRSLTLVIASSPSASRRLSGEGAATMRATSSPSETRCLLAGSSPLVSRIMVSPVIPAGTRRARVSVRTGAAASTRTRAITRRASSGSRRRLSTSPILMPLNSTVPPLDRPETASWKTMS